MRKVIVIIAGLVLSISASATTLELSNLAAPPEGTAWHIIMNNDFQYDFVGPDSGNDRVWTDVTSYNVKHMQAYAISKVNYQIGASGESITANCVATANPLQGMTTHVMINSSINTCTIMQTA